jgi:hypothetical protein
VSGFVDTYYGCNTNRVDPQLRNFDTSHDTFSLSLAEIAFERKVTTDSRVGFRADLDFGPTTDLVHSSEPSDTGKEVYKHIQQGYVSALAGSRLQLDFGKFATPHGAEVIEAKDDWNYSRSLLFALAIPYYHVGLRASLPLGNKASFVGYLVNGWNNSTENNGGKTWGLCAVLKPARSLTWAANVMRGPEQNDDTADQRTLFDTTLTWTADAKLSLMANYDHGSDRVGGQDVSWQGIAVYARYQAAAWWALVGRVEWLDDPNAFMTGIRQKPGELTITSEQRIGGLITRLEYRRDSSDKPFFAKSDATLSRSQSTFTIGAIYAFGGKI